MNKIVAQIGPVVKKLLEIDRSLWYKAPRYFDF
ncbi:hypothetical protein AAUPMB_19665 [Pasteurella multocida subsp. multocida str. Anand1_buffalo]|nr:hypothetical protein AAUPMB_19665 [Pasteurella multocida subsp. multocida str. Anand1_buffalo]